MRKRMRMRMMTRPSSIKHSLLGREPYLLLRVAYQLFLLHQFKLLRGLLTASR